MIRPVPLEAAAFARFGEVLDVPAMPGRATFERALSSTRPSAWPSLSMTLRAPLAAAAGTPMLVTAMERHAFSSQSFVPLVPVRWLVLVAPHLPGGGPDMAAAQAFLPGPGQGVTYGADVWHHGLTVLDAPAPFAVLMWRDGTITDEEFVDVDPLAVEWPP